MLDSDDLARLNALRLIHSAEVSFAYLGLDLVLLFNFQPNGIKAILQNILNNFLTVGTVRYFLLQTFFWGCLEIYGTFGLGILLSLGVIILTHLLYYRERGEIVLKVWFNHRFLLVLGWH